MNNIPSLIFKLASILIFKLASIHVKRLQFFMFFRVIIIEPHKDLDLWEQTKERQIYSTQVL